MTDPQLIGHLRILEAKLVRLTDAIIELQAGTAATERLAKAVEEVAAHLAAHNEAHP